MIDTKNIPPAIFRENHAQFSGIAKQGRHKPALSFTVDVYDNGPDGKNDRFIIQVSNGYSAQGPLSSGNITIR